MPEPAFKRRKEALRKNIAEATERAFLAVGPKGNKIHWFLSDQPNSSTTNGSKR